MDKDNKNTEVNDTDKKLHISDVMRLLSNDVCHEASEIQATRLGNNMELVRDSVRATNFEKGFFYARKLLLDALNNNA